MQRRSVGGVAVAVLVAGALSAWGSAAAGSSPRFDGWRRAGAGDVTPIDNGEITHWQHQSDARVALVEQFIASYDDAGGRRHRVRVDPVQRLLRPPRRRARSRQRAVRVPAAGEHPRRVPGPRSARPGPRLRDDGRRHGVDVHAVVDLAAASTALLRHARPTCRRCCCSTTTSCSRRPGSTRPRTSPRGTSSVTPPSRSPSRRRQPPQAGVDITARPTSGTTARRRWPSRTAWSTTTRCPSTTTPTPATRSGTG